MHNSAIMYSGGIDSSFIIASLIDEQKQNDAKFEIYPLAFDDDTLNFKLRRSIAIEQITQHYGLYRNLQWIRTYDIEKLRQNDSFGFIPGWKLVLQMTAMAHAQSLQCDKLYMGYCRENEEYPYTYKDELQDNIFEAARLYNKIYDANITIELPLIDLTKEEIIARAWKLGMPLEKTISCRATHLGGLMHCGKCLPCKSRIKGFDLAIAAFDDPNLKDPTMYYDRNAATDPVKFGYAGSIRKDDVVDHFEEQARVMYAAIRSKEVHMSLEWNDLTESDRDLWIKRYRKNPNPEYWTI